MCLALAGGRGDSPLARPSIDELAALVRALANHPKALGLQLTIYDPAADADRSCAARLVALLERCWRKRDSLETLRNVDQWSSSSTSAYTDPCRACS
jgi:hypothetical protein